MGTLNPTHSLTHSLTKAMFINADVKENAWVYQLCGAVAYDLFQTLQ